MGAPPLLLSPASDPILATPKTVESSANSPPLTNLSAASLISRKICAAGGPAKVACDWEQVLLKPSSSFVAWVNHPNPYVADGPNNLCLATSATTVAAGCLILRSAEIA